jgi:hypothetical protein
VSVRNFHRWCLDQLSLLSRAEASQWERVQHSFREAASKFLAENQHKRSLERDRLNRIARSVIENCRGRHAEFVFTRKGSTVTHIYNSGWKGAPRRAAARYEPKELLSGVAEAAVQSN